jgi:DNA invertase Pin-like site-specific DNA recombinase
LKTCTDELYRSSNDRFPITDESVQGGVRHRVGMKILALIGYARVSTEDQATFSQLDDLRAAGCQVVFEEKASGASRARPELARAVARVGRGDILVVARIDRLARSLVHLLEVIERVEAVGGHFKSLRDPIDTATPQGRFALQVLGAAAELERALIRERTRAGLRAAKARGRVGGNPGLRRRDPEAIRKLSALRDRQYMAELLATLDAWMPRVRAMRPAHSWGKVGFQAQTPEILEIFCFQRFNPASHWPARHQGRSGACCRGTCNARESGCVAKLRVRWP